MDLLSRWRRRKRANARRILSEDAVKHVYSMRAAGRTATVTSLAGYLEISLDRAATLASQLQQSGLLRVVGQGITLANGGERLARRLVRAHRLVERYLTDELGVPLRRIHVEADRAEHGLSQEDVEALDAELGFPDEDPHGDPIPRTPEDRVQHPSVSLLDWPAGAPASIAHIEDEPAQPFREILANGFRPGITVQVVEKLPDALVVTDGLATHRLTHLAASQIAVVEGEWRDDVPLATLDVGDEAVVRRIDAQCRGVSRRRLLDLGFTPGARVRCAFGSVFGRPIAYRVRGTTVALRRDQADRIWVSRTTLQQSSANATGV